MKCFSCGDQGHVASNCPNAELAADGRPPWCGICDQRTRLIGVPGGMLARCQECHPLARENLKQFRRCQSCRELIYEYDTAPCGYHAIVARESRRGEPDEAA
jgi:zinc knuckle protein